MTTQLFIPHAKICFMFGRPFFRQDAVPLKSLFTIDIFLAKTLALQVFADNAAFVVLWNVQLWPTGWTEFQKEGCKLCLQRASALTLGRTHCHHSHHAWTSASTLMSKFKWAPRPIPRASTLGSVLALVVNGALVVNIGGSRISLIWDTKILFGQFSPKNCMKMKTVWPRLGAPGTPIRHQWMMIGTGASNSAGLLKNLKREI